VKLSHFLRDRAAYIAAYLIFGFVVVAVVQLDLAISGASLRYVNVAYLLLLGLVGLFLFLLYEYRRSRGFCRSLEEAAAADDLDALGALEKPASLEQRLVYDAWQRLNARLQSELAKERERSAKRVAMISQWAHHMKTPVSVIHLELDKAANLAGELGSRAPGPELRALLASIAEENARLDALLQMLLNLNRLDDFSGDLRVEKVDLLALARRVVNDHRRAFIAHRVYPTVEEPGPGQCPASGLTVESDPKWLRLILEQVLTNAIKYSARPDREGSVRIRFERLGDGGVVLEVADDGIGIAPEDLGRVFEPFFTGANGRMNARATGMGLYLAREACRRLGHEIRIASAPGQGTRVRLYFAPERTLHAGLSPTPLPGER